MLNQFDGKLNSNWSELWANSHRIKGDLRQSVHGELVRGLLHDDQRIITINSHRMLVKLSFISVWFLSFHEIHLRFGGEGAGRRTEEDDRRSCLRRVQLQDSTGMVENLQYLNKSSSFFCL